MTPKTVPIGNTGKICLAEDTAACPLMHQFGRLNWDAQFSALPELQALTPLDVAVDVGAFVGDTTHELLLRGCRVYAFEPQPDAFYCLQHNCPHATCFNVGLGSGQHYALTNTVTNKGARPLALRAEGTQTVTLDSFKFSRVNFLKIDAEGFEPYVLEGAKETLERCRPIVYIEVNPGMLFQFGFQAEAVLNPLLKFGYHLRKIQGECFYDVVGTL